MFAEEGHALSVPEPQSGQSADGATFTVGSPDGAPQIVFPPDDRKKVTDTTTYPWNTIGELRMAFPNGETYTGTGTLIDKQHVLTAAHNVFGNDIGGWAKTVYFQPARNGEHYPYGNVGATKVFITEGYYTLSPADPNATSDGNVEDYTLYTEDYAVVRLQRPLDLPFMGTFAASDTQLDGAQARITGYPGDKPEGTMWTAAGPLAKPDQHFLFYKVDTWKGQSGSGLFVDLDLPYGKSVVGVHVAGVRRLETNFAVRLTNAEIKQIIAWMRTA
ncbi:trypsin-like serine peptidase [Angustibacter sp. McL0619]|uniref:trypsin-like serine peptidase n=1 Tax=Angustibacter sp. McL0619 TaxID=3415676 RepID=UPI003CEC7E37